MPEHHTVIVVGGGPGGLPLPVILGGWWPYYRPTPGFAGRYPQLHALLERHSGSLLSLDFPALAQAGLLPHELFRRLHHPSERFEGLDQIAMTFRRHDPLDVLLITREEVGGLWNNVPRNLLTLSPGHWMEFAFHPLAADAAETSEPLDPNELILKQRLVDYYHGIPARFGVTERVRTWENVERVTPDPAGFRVTTRHVRTGEARAYTCRYLVWAVGQRCELRSLGVPGEDLPAVARHYDWPDDFPGARVVVVGGGRSSDWAATELHDAGRTVTYLMRQTAAHHQQLIGDSLHLPYYARIAEILRSRSPRFRPLYEHQVAAFAPAGGGVRVCFRGPEGEGNVEADHVLLELGGVVDYSPLQGFPPLRTVPKYDRYRFQCDQVVTHPHNYEAAGIPNLYLGGYLPQGLGLVVYAMHGAAYAIAGDILQREGILTPLPLAP